MRQQPGALGLRSNGNTVHERDDTSLAPNNDHAVLQQMNIQSYEKTSKKSPMAPNTSSSSESLLLTSSSHGLRAVVVVHVKVVVVVVVVMVVVVMR